MVERPVALKMCNPDTDDRFSANIVLINHLYRCIKADGAAENPCVHSTSTWLAVRGKEDRNSCQKIGVPSIDTGDKTIVRTLKAFKER